MSYYRLEVSNNLANEKVLISNLGIEIQPRNHHIHKFQRNGESEIIIQVENGSSDFYWVSLPGKGDYDTNNFKLFYESGKPTNGIELKFKEGVHFKIPGKNNTWKLLFKNLYSLTKSSNETEQTNDNVSIGDKEP